MNLLRSIHWLSYQTCWLWGIVSDFTYASPLTNPGRNKDILHAITLKTKPCLCRVRQQDRWPLSHKGMNQHEWHEHKPSCMINWHSMTKTIRNDQRHVMRWSYHAWYKHVMNKPLPWWSMIMTPLWTWHEPPCWNYMSWPWTTMM